MGQVADYVGSLIAGDRVPVGIGGFTLFARVSDSFKLESEVPSTTVESGNEQHDHIILKPLTLTITGSVADIMLLANPAIAAIQSAQAEASNVASQYAGPQTQAQLQQLSALANQAADAVRALDNLLDTGTQLLELFGDQDESKTIQQRFLSHMETLHYSLALIDIEMPHVTRHNMRVTMFEASTDNGTDTTEFTIEAQEFLTSELKTTVVAAPSTALGGQTDAPVDQGTQAGEPAPTSLLSQILG